MDDEAAILETLSLQLRRDHKVLVAASGAEALRLPAEAVEPVLAVPGTRRF
ncbi:hypothetical protein [Actinoplanes solisilvae]|uniref:hypothetical protein n=1 Tax=Actinoplanes solisilvae TaxID=2486853 RepID=UPI00196ABE4F|nr:hypothetical protein [Actinoplanes solisilvae]